MLDQRKNIRYETTARVIIEGVSKEKALLKDISVTGCRVESPASAAISLNQRYRLKVIPESDAEIGQFFLTAECMWAGTEADSCGFGFNIVESPKGKQFQRYVDYLSWRYSCGNSMTGDNKPDSL